MSVSSALATFNQTIGVTRLRLFLNASYTRYAKRRSDGWLTEHSCNTVYTKASRLWQVFAVCRQNKPRGLAIVYTEREQRARRD